MSLVVYPYIYNLGTAENILASYNQVVLNNQDPSYASVRNNIVQPESSGENDIILTTQTDQAAGGRITVDIENVVAGDAFTLQSTASNVTNTFNWFLLVQNTVSNYSGTTVFLPWIDLEDTTQSYGKITMGDGGQAFLTSKYLVGITSAEAISRIFLTVDTYSPFGFFSAYEITQYDSTTGTVKITATLAFDRSTLNYFIITKNNNPYVSTAGIGSYPLMIKNGSSITCGISDPMVSGSVTINTDLIVFNSIILASHYSFNGAFPGTIFVPNDEIVPAVSFNIHSTSDASTSRIAWFLIIPADQV